MSYLLMQGLHPVNSRLISSNSKIHGVAKGWEVLFEHSVMLVRLPAMRVLDDLVPNERLALCDASERGIAPTLENLNTNQSQEYF